MADVFISFSSKDEPRVTDIHAKLTQRGFDVWWMKDIPVGASAIQTVSAELESAHNVVLAWSRHAAVSPYVEGEIMHAMGTRKLVPVRIEKWAWPAFLASVQYIDLIQGDDQQEAWRSIEERLRRIDPAIATRMPVLAVPRSVGPAGLLLGAALTLVAALTGLFLVSEHAIRSGDADLLAIMQYAVLALPALAAAPLIIATQKLWTAWRDRPEGAGA